MDERHRGKWMKFAIYQGSQSFGTAEDPLSPHLIPGGMENTSDFVNDPQVTYRRRDEYAPERCRKMVDMLVLKGCMLRFGQRICQYRVVMMILVLLVAILLVPLALGIAAGLPVSSVFLLITSTLGLQAAAALVGIGLGLHPVFILLITTSVAAGIIYGIYEACELFAQSSPRITRWLEKIEDKTRNVPYLSRYGPVMLIPIIWIPGISLFGSPLVAWLFRWNQLLSLVCMIIGWMIAVIVVMGTSLGLLRLFFLNRSLYRIFQEVTRNIGIDTGTADNPHGSLVGGEGFGGIGISGTSDFGCADVPNTTTRKYLA
jgi:hypothetical protein